MGAPVLKLHVERPYGEPGTYISDEHTALVAKLWEGKEHYAPVFAAAPELLKACNAALAYLAPPASKFKSNRDAAVKLLREAVEKAEKKPEAESLPYPPGYPGPCPKGMDWSDWLAMNNVD